MPANRCAAGLRFAAEARAEHGRGLLRLFLLHFREQVKYFEKTRRG